MSKLGDIRRKENKRREQTEADLRSRVGEESEYPCDRSKCEGTKMVIKEKWKSDLSGTRLIYECPRCGYNCNICKRCGMEISSNCTICGDCEKEIMSSLPDGRYFCSDQRHCARKGCMGCFPCNWLSFSPNPK